MAETFELFSRDGGFYDENGERVQIKGVNWFGFETADWALHGLWMVNMNKTLDFVAEHFNAIRMPFSAELALDMDGKRPGNIDGHANPELKGLTTGQVVDVFVNECAKRGILVMLDLHRLDAAGGIPDLWYSAQFPESAVLQAWRTIVLRYKDCWNVFAADLNNEPHGAASWGDGNLATDWQQAAMRIAKVVLEANPKLLIFVEGVETNAVVQPGENCWWGGHIAAAKEAPIVLPVADKLVFSPHVYGPDVHKQPYFGHPEFPANMPDIWMRHFGFCKTEGLGPAICFGEWGGWGNEGPDRVWQNALVDWMIENDVTDSFYWCLNPNSGDTGGVLQDDWVHPHEHKLEIIARAHPNPTKWAPSGTEVIAVAPAAEDTAVESEVDPAAFKAAPKAAPRGVTISAAAAPAPPAGRLVFESEMLAAYLANSWQEGGTVPCSQYEVKVTNTTGTPLVGLRVLFEGVTDLAKSWNCTDEGALEDVEGGMWAFGLPEWCAITGLQPGAHFMLGAIVRGAQPTSFQVELAPTAAGDDE